MTASHSTIVSRRAGTIVRAALFAGAAALLAGCYGPRDSTVASAPDDYRLRHPIAIKDGDRRVEVFIGAKRGSLSPVQRAEVLAFAQACRNHNERGEAGDEFEYEPNREALAVEARMEPEGRWGDE